MSEPVTARPRGPMIAEMFAWRFACVSTTPLGAAVDPDVNCKSAGASIGTAIGRVRDGPARRSSTKTVLVGSAFRRTGFTSSGSTSAVVTTALARLASRMCCDWRANVGRSPACAGGHSGTGTSPATLMPKNTRMKSPTSGITSATRSPVVRPRACSAPAICSDSASSVLYASTDARPSCSIALTPRSDEAAAARASAMVPDSITPAAPASPRARVLQPRPAPRCARVRGRSAAR